MTTPNHCEGCGAFMREHPGNHWTCTRCGTEHDVGSVTPRPASPVLYDADPNCAHQIVAKASGVKCARCPGWFCY